MRRRALAVVVALALAGTARAARAADDLITWHLGRRPKARALVHELT